MNETLLKIKNLKTYFSNKSGLLNFKQQFIKAVDNISIDILNCETLGVVGESGSGKTTLGRSILKLIKPHSGEIFYNDIDILKLSQSGFRKYRQKLQIIFQDPFSSLNPRMTAGDLITEPLIEFGLINKKDRKNKALELLEITGLSAEYIDRYPHEFSGGQRQRLVIARAIALNPEFIVCDEPVSALDVSVRAQILNLMLDLKNKFELAYLFITHDISVVKFIADRIAVMYGGIIVELAENEKLFANPLHPYTHLLLNSAPVISSANNRKRKNKNIIPEINQIAATGCPFRFRCPQKKDICAIEKPTLKLITSNHFTACHLF